MKGNTAYAFTWISVAVAVSVAIFVTKDASALWAFLLPAMISYSSSEK